MDEIVSPRTAPTTAPPRIETRPS